jgi:hypothetical protein
MVLRMGKHVLHRLAADLGLDQNAEVDWREQSLGDMVEKYMAVFGVLCCWWLRPLHEEDEGEFLRQAPVVLRQGPDSLCVWPLLVGADEFAVLCAPCRALSEDKDGSECHHHSFIHRPEVFLSVLLKAIKTAGVLGS